MKTRHKFRHSFYHQILILARQRLILVKEKRFINEYFLSSSSLTKLTLIQTWSELLVPLVNMIKGGCKNKKSALLKNKNLTFH